MIVDADDGAVIAANYLMKQLDILQRVKESPVILLCE